MIEELLKQERELIRAKILGETAKMPWQELQRFFAAGKLLWVDPALDLIDVAFAFHEDQVDAVKQWTDDSLLTAVADDQARLWVESDTVLWTVVVKPWILVQEKGG